jgi:uncharacterized protein (TIGR02118 family)
MIVTVLYPNHEGARFDAAYYVDHHARLAAEIWAPERIDLIEGSGGAGGGPAPYALVAHFHFASPEALGTAMANPRVAELMADVPNCTDITPQIMIGRALT